MSNIAEAQEIINKLQEQMKQAQEQLLKMNNKKEYIKFPNGALAEKPEEGEDVYIHSGLTEKYHCTRINCLSGSFHALLFNQQLFLTKEEAEYDWHTKRLFFQLHKIIRLIDKKFNWNIADEKSDNFSLFLNYNQQNITKGYLRRDNNTYTGLDVIMSKQAKDFMMSDLIKLEHFAIFLNPYDLNLCTLQRSLYGNIIDESEKTKPHAKSVLSYLNSIGIIYDF